MIARNNNTPGIKATKLALTLSRAVNQAAFTLVEVTLAIGIVAIAIIPVFGLIPTGLNAFHQAIDASVGSQIAQRVINDAQQTDFKTLVGTNTSRFVLPDPILKTKTTRYFDDQGNEVRTVATSIYQTQTIITPIAEMPQNASNVNLATVTVQIANNPRHVTLAADGTTKLWKNPIVPVVTYSAIVSNNQ